MMRIVKEQNEEKLSLHIQRYCSGSVLVSGVFAVCAWPSQSQQLLKRKEKLAKYIASQPSFCSIRDWLWCGFIRCHSIQSKREWNDYSPFDLINLILSLSLARACKPVALSHYILYRNHAIVYACGMLIARNTEWKQNYFHTLHKYGRNVVVDDPIVGFPVKWKYWIEQSLHSLAYVAWNFNALLLSIRKLTAALMLPVVEFESELSMCISVNIIMGNESSDSLVCVRYFVNCSPIVRMIWKHPK